MHKTINKNLAHVAGFAADRCGVYFYAYYNDHSDVISITSFHKHLDGFKDKPTKRKDRGIGMAMLKVVCQVADHYGKAIELWTISEPVVKLYLRLGFEIEYIQTVPSYKGPVNKIFLRREPIG